MKTNYLSFILITFLLTVSCYGQDHSQFRIPGYPDNARFVIIHADDMGMSHSTNAAVIEAFENNAITSGSIMVPCPWFPEIAEYVKENPALDVGVHLTLTSEWKYFRWGSVLPHNEVPSLLDNNGYMYATVEEFAANAKPCEVEKEIRAQIDRAIAFGIRPTHIDDHMGTMLSSPELFSIYQKVAEDYNLPAFVPVNIMNMYPNLKSLVSPSSIPVNLSMFIPEEGHITGWAQGYEQVIANFQPGINVMLVHLSYDNAEMRAIAAGQVDFGSAWRQNDLDYLMSKEFRDHLEKHQIIPITWREVHKAFKEHMKTN